MPRDEAAEHDFKSVFDGVTLTGWHAVPRLPTAPYPGADEPPQDAEYRRAAATTGRWTVVDGAVVGEQDPPGSGYGAYLLTDETYGDFELTIDARPDWPADTGILLRTTARGTQGFQVLIDHRRSGGIGGFYGNGIGGFHALPFNVDVVRDGDGNPVGLTVEDPATSLEPVTEAKRKLLSYAVRPEEFLAAWRWDDWNRFRIRCVGRYPVITSWINDVKIAELDTGAIDHPHYDRDAVATLLGRAGHIALEVHNNDPRMGKDRWGPGAACRWRNIAVRRLG